MDLYIYRICYLLFLNYYFTLFKFFTQALMVFHWSLIDRKSLQVSRTLLTILANLNNAVVWMLLILPLIFSSSSSLSTLLETVPSAPTTIGITIPLMFHSFFFFYFSGKVQVFVNDFAFFHFHSEVHLSSTRWEVFFPY